MPSINKIGHGVYLYGQMNVTIHPWPTPSSAIDEMDHVFHYDHGVGVYRCDSCGVSVHASTMVRAMAAPTPEFFASLGTCSSRVLKRAIEQIRERNRADEYRDYIKATARTVLSWAIY